MRFLTLVSAVGMARAVAANSNAITSADDICAVIRKTVQVTVTVTVDADGWAVAKESGARNDGKPASAWGGDDDDATPWASVTGHGYDGEWAPAGEVASSSSTKKHGYGYGEWDDEASDSGASKYPGYPGYGYDDNGFEEYTKPVSMSKSLDDGKPDYATNGHGPSSTSIKLSSSKRPGANSGTLEHSVRPIVASSRPHSDKSEAHVPSVFPSLSVSSALFSNPSSSSMSLSKNSNETSLSLSISVSSIKPSASPSGRNPSSAGSESPNSSSALAASGSSFSALSSSASGSSLSSTIATISSVSSSSASFLHSSASSASPSQPSSASSYSDRSTVSSFSSAASSSSTKSSFSSSSSTPPACAPNMSACTSTSDCCDVLSGTTCNNRICQPPPPPCRLDGQICVTTGQCCFAPFGTTCRDGLCQRPPPSCIPDDSGPCTANDECCEDSVCNAGTCRAPTSCIPDGVFPEPCFENEDCCGFETGSVCNESNMCQVPPSCVPDNGSTCVTDDECCSASSGTICSNGECLPRPRCLPDFNGLFTCSANSDCCTSSAGTTCSDRGVCTPCRTFGMGCFTSADCCDTNIGFACVLGTCQFRQP